MGGLSVRGMGGEHTPIGKDGTVDISPSARFCITEAEIVTALYKGIKLLKEQEDALAPKKEEAEPLKVEEPVKVEEPKKEEPAAVDPADLEIKTVNGKLVVDEKSAPGCVEKILKIKAD